MIRCFLIDKMPKVPSSSGDETRVRDQSESGKADRADGPAERAGASGQSNQISVRGEG
jgi:hypothetical protein